MNYFVMPANPEIYDSRSAFNSLGKLHWIQGRNKSVRVGDIIYIYEGLPTSSIILKTEVLERDVVEYVIEDKKFYFNEEDRDRNKIGPWFILKKLKDIDPMFTLENMRELGLKGNIQSLRSLDKNIVNMIEKD